MSNVNDSAAWQLGYEAYMQDKEITDNIFASESANSNSIEWTYGYLDAQIEVEGLESVQVVPELVCAK